jgi:nucleoid DNA-binding protein
MNENYNKADIVRELASRAQFTQEDVRLLLNTFEDLIREVVENQDILTWTGVLRLNTKLRKAHKGWDGIRKQPLDLPDDYRVTITASGNLCHLVKRDSELEQE